jgi:hypothetical protein
MKLNEIDFEISSIKQETHPQYHLKLGEILSARDAKLEKIKERFNAQQLLISAAFESEVKQAQDSLNSKIIDLKQEFMLNIFKDSIELKKYALEDYGFFCFNIRRINVSKSFKKTELGRLE